jgi:hypothetical protein
MPAMDAPLVTDAVPSATRTTSGDSGPLPGYGSPTTLRAALTATAMTGTTPTLDVELEDSLDGGETWFTLATFPQRTTAGSNVLNVTSAFGPHLRGPLDDRRRHTVDHLRRPPAEQVTR